MSVKDFLSKRSKKDVAKLEASLLKLRDDLKDYEKNLLYVQKNNKEKLHKNKDKDFEPERIEDEVIYGEEMEAEQQVRLEERVNAMIGSVLREEAGYQRNTKDKGNYYKGKLLGTNKGITPEVLAKHLGRDVTMKDMKELDTATASEIYREKYYDRYHIGDLPPHLQNITLHSVVNGGNNGIKIIQKLSGLKEDGIIGPDTLAAMENASFTKQEFKDTLLDKYKTYSNWDEFGKGWTNRFTSLASDTTFDTIASIPDDNTLPIDVAIEADGTITTF